jgi:transporter family protein
MANISNWLLWALLSAMFAALTAIFAKVGLEKVDSDFATFIRTMVIIVVLFAFVYLTGKWTNPFQLSKHTLVFLVLSALATGASWVCYFRALKAGHAANVSAIDKLSVVLIAVFAFLFLHERPSVREWIGILMVGLGVFIIGLKR